MEYINDDRCCEMKRGEVRGRSGTTLAVEQSRRNGIGGKNSAALDRHQNGQPVHITTPQQLSSLSSSPLHSPLLGTRRIIVSYHLS